MTTENEGFNTDDKSKHNSTKEGSDQPFAIVGERVFHTQADLAKYYENANSTIENLKAEKERLEREKQELVGKVQHNVTAQEILSEVQKGKTSQPANTTPEPAQPSSTDLRATIKEVMSEFVSENKQKTNLLTVMAEAEKVYGSDYQNKVVNMAREMGQSVEDVNNLAKKSPEVFRKLFLPQEKKDTAGFTSGPSQGHNLPLGNQGGEATFGEKFLQADGFGKVQMIKERASELTKQR